MIGFWNSWGVWKKVGCATSHRVTATMTSELHKHKCEGYAVFTLPLVPATPHG